MSDHPNVLVVGDADHTEFSRVRDWLRRLPSDAVLRFARGLMGDCDDNSTSPGAPDFVIVCQSWPDEFSASEVSAALGCWPLALWVCCYGAWCSSDGRTRSIWPISVRVPIEEAEQRLNHVWQVLTEHRGEPLPLTASRDEAFEFDHSVTTSAARP